MADRDFDKLFKEHRQRLKNYCRRFLSNEEDCEDAVLETFYRAIKSSGGFRGDSPFFGWLCGVARLVCLNMIDRSPKTTPMSVVENTLTSIAKTPDQQVLKSQLAGQVIKISSDPPAWDKYDYLIFNLYFCEDEPTFAEVAQKLDLPPNTVRWHYYSHIVPKLKLVGENGKPGMQKG